MEYHMTIPSNPTKRSLEDVKINSRSAKKSHVEDTAPAEAIQEPPQADTGPSAEAFLGLLAPSKARMMGAASNSSRQATTKDVIMSNTGTPSNEANERSVQVERNQDAKRLAQERISKVKAAMMRTEGAVYNGIVEDGRYLWEGDAHGLKVAAEELMLAAKSVDQAASMALEVPMKHEVWFRSSKDFGA